MPVYEFLCTACDSRYDDLVGINESLTDQRCPDCASTEVEKLVSSFRSKVQQGTGDSILVNGHLPGPSSPGSSRAGGCCGGSCGAC
ncbi:MAG: regulatory protein FmdB family [Thermoleophilia bacterium]|nr:regulatory protein FmdB family [Thermoleophilia bacterium]